MQTTLNPPLQHSGPEPLFSFLQHKTCCSGKLNAQKTCNVMAVFISLGALVTSGTILTRELLKERSIETLATSAFLNGASIACLAKLLVPSQPLQAINNRVSKSSYPALFALSQIFLNLPLSKQKLFGILFIWGYGALKFKDLLTLFSSLPATSLNSLQEFPLLSQDQERLKMIGYSPRDTSRCHTLISTGMAIAALSFTIFNFTHRDELFVDDLGKLGFYQDAIALFSGNFGVLGIAEIIENWKENLAAQHSIPLLNPHNARCQILSLKGLHFFKKLFEIFIPVAVGGLLSIKQAPNSTTDYWLKFTIGALYCTSQLWKRRDFELRSSPLHAARIRLSQPSLISTQERVKQLTRQYMPSIIALGLLVSYMTYVATQSTQHPIDVYAITAFLFSTLLSYSMTNITAHHYSSQKEQRFINEIAFRLLCFLPGITIPFQYFSSKLELDDQHLIVDPQALKYLAAISWFLLGLALGNDLAVNIHQSDPQPETITSPLTMQQLTKFFFQYKNSS